ncbi:brorin-like isoform X3 [Biomphalaria pfeifferi]|uniref:Brorin-like isoform X3 n=1 Tax=Biomphalaria pfeifferi TaxID=112525 RepID=A0AAD8BTN2_BIOPF|nr:brorin-like isoform X3 [Biomphalaria pfeifferi]
MLFRFAFLYCCTLFIELTRSAPKRDTRLNSWLSASGIRKFRSPEIQEGTRAPEMKSGLSTRWGNMCKHEYQSNYPVACYLCDNCSQVASEYNPCAIGDCLSQQCADFVLRPGNCCASCPNGPNCWVENRLIPMGNVVSFPNGTTCNCIYGSNQVVRTLCSYLSNGVVVEYFHGPDYVSWI